MVATDVKAFSPSPPTEQDLIGQDLNSRYLNAQGGPEVVGAGGSARPLAFQFHQHNHQRNLFDMFLFRHHYQSL